MLDRLCYIRGMKKIKKTPVDLNKLAAFLVDQATNEKPLPEETDQKNPAAVYLGRLGGLKGGKARAAKLSEEQRKNIARIAAAARWSNVYYKGGHMERLKWRKRLSRSDAQQDTRGAKMPFLRFTRGSIPGDHTTWFREVFFAGADWRHETSRQMHSIETAQIKIHVIINGNDLGERSMKIDHDPARVGNHNAPTTHLHYDAKTRKELESTDLSEHLVVVERDDAGRYSLTVL